MTVRFGPTDLDNGHITGYPVSGPITSYFGVTDGAHIEGHTGVDIGVPEGTPIYCPLGGQVVFTSTNTTPNWWAPTFGNSVIIEHKDGWRSLYAHMKNSPEVMANSEVSRGDLLGHVGSTGKSTGPHLHWGLAVPGNPWFNTRPNDRLRDLRDPLRYLFSVDDPDDVNDQIKEYARKILELLGD